MPSPLTAIGHAAMPDGPCLHSRAWDRIFLVGGAVLVPIPILLFLALRGVGMPIGVSEDLVTLCVMLPLGGPHVLATFSRTLFNVDFWRRERGLAIASILLLGSVLTAAITSAFFDVQLAGCTPMAFLLTFFFFWAGLHVVQQHCYVAASLADRAPPQHADRLGAVDHFLMLLALYPVSLFRMSMASGADPTSVCAAPDALATRIVLAMGASPEFANAYVFRIGRAAPVLPEFLRHPACWILVTAAFMLCLLLYLGKSWAASRRSVPFGTRGRLVLAMAGFGAVVPLFPNLDAALQGINAWHSFQYLGLSWLLNRRAIENGELRAPRLVGLLQPGRALRAYGMAIAATLGLVVLILTAAVGLQAATSGRFVLFGHDVPPTDPTTGRALYRPGSVLLAYYLFGFGFLLIHYLQDTVLFLRRRGLAVARIDRAASP